MKEAVQMQQHQSFSAAMHPTFDKKRKPVGVVFSGCVMFVACLCLISLFAGPYTVSNDNKSSGAGGSTIKYVTYDAYYGQLGNQRMALVNALLVAEHLGATLVIPFARINRGLAVPDQVVSDYVVGRNRRRNEDLSHSLIGRYYDYHRDFPRLISERDFLQTDDYKFLKDKLDLGFTKTGYFEDRLGLNGSFDGEATELDRMLCPFRQGICVPQLWCRHLPEFQHGSFGSNTLLMPRVFNKKECSHEDSRWLAIDRALRPRRLFESAVDRFLEPLKRPLFGVHLRFLPEEFETVTKGNRFSATFMNRFAIQFASAKSIYIAYNPKDSFAVERAAELSAKLRASGKAVYEFGDLLAGQGANEETLRKNLQANPYGSALLDITTLAKCDTFAGRDRSTFSAAADRLADAYRASAVHTRPYSVPDFE